MSPVLGVAEEPGRGGAAYIKPGSHIELVSWRPAAEGFEAVLVDGKYLGRTLELWSLQDAAGEVATYPRDRWQVCHR